MAKVYSTPGVYIEEKNAFSNSVVPVATAIPCFIGFTQKATRDHKSLSNKLFKIASFDEFNRYFGGSPRITYKVTVDPEAVNPIDVVADTDTQFFLYHSLKLYFDNGGGECYIFSVGDFSKGNKMEKPMVETALKQLLKEPEPTIIVIPDGHTIESAEDYYGLWQLVLPHCREMINRFAILDIHGGGKMSNLVDNAAIDELYTSFKDGIGINDLNYGAVYWPWVQASVVQPSDLDFRNISNFTELQEKMKAEVNKNFPKLPNGEPNPRAEKITSLIGRLGKLDTKAFADDAIMFAAKAKRSGDKAANVDATDSVKLAASIESAKAANESAKASKSALEATEKALTNEVKAALKNATDATTAVVTAKTDVTKIANAVTAVQKAVESVDTAAKAVDVIAKRIEADAATAAATAAKELADAAKVLVDLAAKAAEEAETAAVTAAKENATKEEKEAAMAAKIKADVASAKAKAAVNAAAAAQPVNSSFSLSDADISRQHNAILQISALYKSVMMRLRETANILPPSAAMAGAYKAVDSSIGTHQAPANISMISVSKPLVHLDDHEQENLNVPVDGKAINAIRTFPGKGVLVWGARTMDGNSQDWRYISVRRTVSMIELSIKYAAEAFVFEPNVSSTWSNLKAMITNFLTNMWYSGALAGATPESSFSVDVGLGSTMTPIDILDGYMRISVKIAVTRPAEFIVITFEQQMQTS